ncbi:MAG: right-handed parallel beta-helix repeat-containing protein, partial [bacterium]
MKSATVSLLCIGVLALASPVVAMTYVVRPDGTGDFPTIQEAINAVADGDTIELTNGTFAGVGNRDIDYLGKVIVVRSQSGSPDSCIIDCNIDGRGFHFHSGEAAGSTLEGIKVTHGNAEYGGGICCENASPMIVSCSISDNGIWGEGSGGGGVYCTNNSSPTFVNCTIDLNSVPATSGGGGIYCEGSIASFTNCVILHNGAGDGGGVFCLDSSPTFSNCVISGNVALYAGGVSCDNSSAIFTDCTISGNTADAIAGDGGGVACLGPAAPIFTNCVLVGNSSSGWLGNGGGLSCVSCSVTLTNCTIADNWATESGGGVVCGASSPTFDNCTINGNSSHEGEGGGVLCSNSAATFTNCTFIDNTAWQSGGAVYCISSSPTFMKCTFGINSGSPGGGLYCEDSAPILNSSIIAFCVGSGIYFR